MSGIPWNSGHLQQKYLIYVEAVLRRQNYVGYDQITFPAPHFPLYANTYNYYDLIESAILAFIPKVVCLCIWKELPYSRGNCSTIIWHRSVLYTTLKAIRLNKTLRVNPLITDSDTYNMLYEFAMF